MPTDSRYPVPPHWRQRFASDTVLWVHLLKATPHQAIVARTADDRYRWQRCDLDSGVLTPIILPPRLATTLAPDGRHEEAHFIDAPNGSAVVVLQDDGGSDVGHLVYVPLDGRPPVDLTPDLPPYLAFATWFSPAGDRLGFTATLPDNDTQTFVLELQPDGTPHRRHTLFTSRHIAAGPWIAPADDLALVASTERTTPPNFSFVALDLRTMQRISELWDGPAAGVGLPPLFSPLPGDGRVLTSTDHANFRRPLVWQPRTGERTLIDLPTRTADILPLCWAPDGRRIVLSELHAAQQHLYMYDLATAQAQPIPHPPGSYGIVDWLPSGELVALWQDAAHPAHVVALDVTTGTHRTLLQPAASVPGRAWRSVQVPSSDGQQVQCWLATPAGAGPFPTIIEVHGGPRGVITNTFRPDSQAWLDQGFAFLSVNYRGSTTFGVQFRDQIVGDPGHWELEDVVAAQTWLLREGIAALGRIVLVGESYGGYLTLLALGRYPALWAGGIAINGIADWTAVYAETAAPGQRLAAAYFGGTPAEQAARYRDRSPITYAQQVRAPVLIIHGRHDAHATVGQMKRYIHQLQEAAKPVEIIWFDGGHGGSQRVDHLERMLAFAQRSVQSQQAT